jgi:type I restriction enzyme M protein
MEYEEVKYEDPKIIIEKIEKLEEEIIQGIKELKDNEKD